MVAAASRSLCLPPACHVGKPKGGEAVAHARVGTAPFPTHLTTAVWRQKRGAAGLQVRGRRGGANGARAGVLVTFKGRRRSSVCQSAVNSRRHRSQPSPCLVYRKLNTAWLLLLLLPLLSLSLLLLLSRSGPVTLNADVEEQENAQWEWLWRPLPRRSLQRVSSPWHCYNSYNMLIRRPCLLAVHVQTIGGRTKHFGGWPVWLQLFVARRRC